ncbi:unnamed protein product [Auanema sp. JU1783]|nr:unnamed protein product [Auanema sp. JU1783]
MADVYQEVVDKLCRIYADDSEKCAEIMNILAIDDAICGGRVNSGMWKMLKSLVAFDEPFKRYSEKLVLSVDKMPSRPVTPMSRVSSERSTSPYHPELPHDPAPSAKCFKKWMFYLNEQTKSTTICVHPKFFVTFRHGTHSHFNIGDSLKIYPVEEENGSGFGVDVRVANIYEAYDFILLKSEFNVVDRGPTIARAQESEPFTLVGFGNDIGCLSYLPGSIHSNRGHYFQGEVQLMGPFILGTSRRSCGDFKKWKNNSPFSKYEYNMSKL